MSITLNIPQDAEYQLREVFGKDLDRTAFEALVIEGYRTRKYGVAVVRQLLGLENRWQAEQWLAEHGVHSNYSLEDLDADRQTIQRVFGARG